LVTGTGQQLLLASGATNDAPIPSVLTLTNTANDFLAPIYVGGAQGRQTLAFSDDHQLGNAANTITIVPSANINGGSTFSVIIPSAGNALRNPLVVNNYTLQVHTSCQPTDGTSFNYAIGTSGTTLSVNTVTVTPATVGNIASYATSINLSSDGGLVGTVSTITVTFPAGTVVPAGALSVTGLTVGGVQVDAANGAGQAITLTIHQDIAASTNNVAIFFPASLTLRNPTTQANYQLSVSTSVQTTAGNSGLYFIGTSSSNLVIHAVTVTPPTVGNLAGYSFSFDTSSDGALVGGTSQLIIVFPGTTSVPAAPSLVGLTIGGQTVDAATGSGNTLFLTIHQTIVASTSNINVVIPVGSGIRNPLTAGNYTLQGATSAQPSGTSPVYTITSSGNAVTVGAVTPSPNTVGSGSAAYSFTVTTSSDGPLFGGTSEVTTLAPALRRLRSPSMPSTSSDAGMRRSGISRRITAMASNSFKVAGAGSSASGVWG